MSDRGDEVCDTIHGYFWGFLCIAFCGSIPFQIANAIIRAFRSVKHALIRLSNLRVSEIYNTAMHDRIHQYHHAARKGILRFLNRLVPKADVLPMCAEMNEKDTDKTQREGYIAKRQRQIRRKHYDIPSHMFDLILVHPLERSTIRTSTDSTDLMTKMMILGLDLPQAFTHFFTIDTVPTTPLTIDYTYKRDAYPQHILSSLATAIILCPSLTTLGITIQERNLVIDRAFGLVPTPTARRQQSTPHGLVIFGPESESDETRKCLDMAKMDIEPAWTLLLAVLSTIAAHRWHRSNAPDQVLYYVLPQGVTIPDSIFLVLPKNIENVSHGGTTFAGITLPDQVVLSFKPHWADQVVWEWWKEVGKKGWLSRSWDEVVILAGRVGIGKGKRWEDKLPGWVHLPMHFWEAKTGEVLAMFEAD